MPRLPPSVIALALQLVAWLVYWSTFRSQVPLYLSSRKVRLTLEIQLPADRPCSSSTSAPASAAG